MPSQRPQPVPSPVVRNVRSRQNQQKRGPSGNSQLPPAKRRVSVPAGERDSSQGGSYVASTIKGQNSTPSSSLNNSRVADITPSATQRWSIVTLTTTLGTSSRSIHRFGQTDMTRLVFATGRLLELYMWNRWPFMSASDLGTVSYARRRVAKPLPEAPHL